MATRIHGAGPTGQRSPGLDLAIAGYLAENGGGGAGVELVDGTVTLDDTGSPVREFYCTDAATINGVAFDADSAVVFRRTSADVWGYIIVEPWTDISATTTTTTTEATTTTTTTEAATTTTTTTEATTTTTTTAAAGPAVVQSKSASANTLTLDAAPTEGNLLVVAATAGSDPATWTWTHSLTIDAQVAQSGWRSVLASATVASGASATVTVTGLTNGQQLTVWEMSGVTGLLDFATASSGSNVNSLAVGPVDTTDAIVVLGVSMSANFSAPFATGMTAVGSGSRGFSMQAIGAADPFSTTASWTNNGTPTAALGAYA